MPMHTIDNLQQNPTSTMTDVWYNFTWLQFTEVEKSQSAAVLSWHSIAMNIKLLV